MFSLGCTLVPFCMLLVLLFREQKVNLYVWYRVSRSLWGWPVWYRVSRSLWGGPVWYRVSCSLWGGPVWYRVSPHSEVDLLGTGYHLTLRWTCLVQGLTSLWGGPVWYRVSRSLWGVRLILCHSVSPCTGAQCRSSVTAVVIFSAVLLSVLASTNNQGWTDRTTKWGGEHRGKKETQRKRAASRVMLIRRYLVFGGYHDYRF